MQRMRIQEETKGSPRVSRCQQCGEREKVENGGRRLHQKLQVDRFAGRRRKRERDRTPSENTAPKTANYTLVNLGKKSGDQ